ncbi:DUF2452 domain-containing protein [Catalinimonas niigatensis]|uniref:DUF2452 domain-containing protein n=1 Tax=Catalinimonas niigatensis TaxID=1397264 RepID=UPI002AA2B15A|nr:DUF2452 domain-containing protein [Catalinimonas niigatensis]WPP50579.1 DUF2452 domain-containing protein [Catalinimonas niigatensis]
MVNKKGRKVNLDQIDLEKEKDKITDTPGTLAFPHTVGGALIKPEDRGRIKGRAVSAMHQQTDRQMKQLYEQMETLVRQANQLKQRVEVSERIYLAQMNFEPLIGHTYYLYEKKDGSDVLSMISPEEWGKSMPFNKIISKTTLLSDHTWDTED